MHIALMLLITCCVCTTALADSGPTVEVQVPDGLVIESPADSALAGMAKQAKLGESFNCFPSAQWEQMGRLITDYRWFFKTLPLIQQQMTDKDSQIKLLTQNADNWKSAQEAANDAVKTMGNLYDDEHRLRLANETSLKLRLGIVSALAIAEVAALAGMTVAYELKK